MIHLYVILAALIAALNLAFFVWHLYSIIKYRHCEREMIEFAREVSIQLREIEDALNEASDIVPGQLRLDM